VKVYSLVISTLLVELGLTNVSRWSDKHNFKFIQKIP